MRQIKRDDGKTAREREFIISKKVLLDIVLKIILMKHTTQEKLFNMQ